MQLLTKWPEAQDIMTREVLAAQADWPLQRLAEFFVQHSISGAPVLNEEGHLIGVVSHSDLIRFEELPDRNRPRQTTSRYYQDMLNTFDEDEMDSIHLVAASNTHVQDIMTPSIFSVKSSAPVQEIADMMLRGRIHRVFVTENKQVIGIVTAMDILKVIRHL